MLFVVCNILKIDLTIAFLIAIMILIFCPSASAVENPDNENLAKIKVDDVNKDSFQEVHRTQGKVVLIYNEDALDEDDMELNNKNDIIPVQGGAVVENKKMAIPPVLKRTVWITTMCVTFTMPGVK